MSVGVQRNPSGNTDKDIEIRKDGPKDDDTMELESITGAGPTSSYFIETMLDGRINKLYFKDDLDTERFLSFLLQLLNHFDKFCLTEFLKISLVHIYTVRYF